MLFSWIVRDRRNISMDWKKWKRWKRKWIVFVKWSVKRLHAKRYSNIANWLSALLFEHFWLFHASFMQCLFRCLVWLLYGMQAWTALERTNTCVIMIRRRRFNLIQCRWSWWMKKMQESLPIDEAWRNALLLIPIARKSFHQLTLGWASVMQPLSARSLCRPEAWFWHLKLIFLIHFAAFLFLAVNEDF